MNTIVHLLHRASTAGSIVLLLIATFAFAPTLGRADETPSDDRSAGDSESRLTERQTGLASRYGRLEELLLRLAEVESAENPERSALLRRAARQSRDKFVLDKMRNASDSLRTMEFQKAVTNQTGATEELSSLLKLLLSEDRSKRIRDEKDRYAKLAKELKRTIRAQRSTRARTENDADFDQVEEEQKSIGDRTEKLTKQLAEENRPSGMAPKRKSDEAKSNDPEQSPDGQPTDKPEEKDDIKDGEKQQPKDGTQPKGSEKPKDSDSKQDSNSKPSESDSPSQSEPGQPNSDSKPQPSQSPQKQSQQGEAKPPQQSPPSQQNQSPRTPEQQVEEQLRQAIKKMREAEKDLDHSEREKATEQQRAAEENLRAAIDQLERILRQLREEEMQRELAKLEARLRKMAAMQSKILDATVALAATPASQRNRQTDLKAGDLAFEEKKVSMEADRAMLLLREEGSSVAFPEVISQIRVDTVRVTNFLGESKIDVINQGIQMDILAALEEMIAATQSAQRDLEQKRQKQQGKPQQGGQKEEPLVESLAELKLIRTMETRIKSTTQRYASLLESGDLKSNAQTAGDGGQGDSGRGDGDAANLENRNSVVNDVLPLLQDLSERQNRLYRITRDLVLKRNK